MDLPDCPPGTEGYDDSVTEIPKKPDTDESCTKAEQEFQEHVNSLKITLEDGEIRCMVQRHSRDNGGKWVYKCLPCAAICNGEVILQTHITGRKHKNKLSQRSVWPKSILEDQPISNPSKDEETEKPLQDVTEEVNLPSDDKPCEVEHKFSKYKNVTCQIQEALDSLKTSLVGVEYLIEHPPERAHYEPTYLCTLCNKQGHPRTIINHMTCFWHNINYIKRHFSKAESLLIPFRGQWKYREGTLIVVNRLTQRIEDTYGRMRPLHIDKDEYERNKNEINQWIFQSKHFCERDGCTFEEVVDVNLIDSLYNSSEKAKGNAGNENKRDPSPPVVAAPTKPLFNSFTPTANRQERRAISIDSLSDISDVTEEQKKEPSPYRTKYEPNYKSRYEPYPEKKKVVAYRSRYSIRNDHDTEKKNSKLGYKYQLAEDKKKTLVESAKKTLAYHEKNPEKHPLYPDEWKKFWNKRYKEIQAEGKDPSKHDFKPEWIVFWTKRMKELHEDELRIQVNEMYRKLCISPSDITRRSAERRRSPEVMRRSPEVKRRLSEVKRRSPELKRRSPELKRRSPELKRRSPELKRRSPELKRRSPENRRRSPELKRWSPVHKRRSPVWQRSTERRRSPEIRRDYRRELRSPEFRRSPVLRHSPPRQSRIRSRSPSDWRRSPSSTRLQTLPERTGSPLSQRDATLLLRNRSPEIAPSLQTVLVSDDDLEPDISSVHSMMEGRSRAGSEVSRGSRVGGAYRHASVERGPDLQDMGPAENVVATLRLLVALEHYLGSLGPKIVDLLTEALRMEKEAGNSSEKLLECEPALVLMETAKEKLKGAMQAGLVSGGAALAAVRAAVVRVAATLHEADSRRSKPTSAQTAPSARTQEPSTSGTAAVPVAGVGEVDRALIAQQMAEALIAQGKTDVTSEELAQLVEAVVGMAEANKMEAQKNSMPSRSLADQNLPPSKTSSAASALQMLQTAYDENEKKMEKAEAAVDAMDGLSDSDLETLLKNFNELSAEEQHSLIAYLKKLEAREPQRVERLRQYVGAAAPNAAPILHELPQHKETASVTIQSDDDEDYSVDEVFQSATQKVKEDQIRQEMEIVKKSLEETKSTLEIELCEKNSIMEIARNISSASDLLALVQASIQSTARVAPMAAPTADVVTTNIQPRSFGDAYDSPQAPSHEPIKPLLQSPIQLNLRTPAPQNIFNHQPQVPQMGTMRPPLQNFNTNRSIPNPNYNQGTWNQQQPMNNNIQDARTSLLRPNYSQHQYNNQAPQGNFMNGRQQDNFEMRPVEANQQYGGYQDQQNSFRGRGGGRGNYGRPKRGRGQRGFYQ